LSGARQRRDTGGMAINLKHEHLKTALFELIDKHKPTPAEFGAAVAETIHGNGWVNGANAGMKFKKDAPLRKAAKAGK
jgi:hypothetical protein